MAGRVCGQIGAYSKTLLIRPVKGTGKNGLITGVAWLLKYTRLARILSDNVSC